MNFKNNINIINNSLILKIKVIPNSSKNELFTIMSNWVYKIRLKAIPENWKANKELINFISYELWIKKSQIKLISWLTDKNKIVKIDF
jgi:uncharacterized protein YggU (UPF0235/DUF167 family)